MTRTGVSWKQRNLCTEIVVSYDHIMIIRNHSFHEFAELSWQASSIVAILKGMIFGCLDALDRQLVSSIWIQICPAKWHLPVKWLDACCTDASPIWSLRCGGHGQSQGALTVSFPAAGWFWVESTVQKGSVHWRIWWFEGFIFWFDVALFLAPVNYRRWANWLHFWLLANLYGSHHLADRRVMDQVLLLRSVWRHRGAK